tara:strand:- start:643 stop:1128 length:486 start_codon:yes stop_codon:yes gene_type:complete
MNTEKRVKRVREQLIISELSELNITALKVIETNSILKELDCKNIYDFELKVNHQTGFVNTLMSASALGFENQYKRLLELEKQIDNKLSLEDLTENNKLSITIISKIREKHTEYYTSEDLKTKKILEDVMKKYNSLSHHKRGQIGFNLQNELIYSPFSELRF